MTSGINDAFYKKCERVAVRLGALGQNLGDMDDEIQHWLIGKVARHDITIADFVRALIVDAYDEDQEAKQ